MTLPRKLTRKSHIARQMTKQWMQAQKTRAENITKTELERDEVRTKFKEFDENKIGAATAKNRVWLEAKKIAKVYGYSGSLDGQVSERHAPTPMDMRGIGQAVNIGRRA